jgi:geranylgeranyl reductase family protein
VERFDALVVGAGPAGSVTAYRLARGGASVLLVDRARFPRDKPCGGGLTLRAVRELPFSVDPVVEDRVERFEIRFRYGRAFERATKTPLVLMTQRRRLDAYLAEQAVEAGAEFRDGVKVEFNGATAKVDGDGVWAEVVVGADGANGITARTLGLGGDMGYGVALEGNVPYTDADEAFRGRMVLELGVIPGGYGWVFPKGDHVNVGVGGWDWTGPTLRDQLARLCKAHGISTEALTDLRGFRLPFRRPKTVLTRDHALVVGDAAGLVDPLSGDGMYEGFVSARLAADAILAGKLDGYAPSVHAELDALSSASWGAKRALDRFPRASFTVASSRLTWPAVEQLLSGEATDPRGASPGTRLPLAVLRALAHRAA